MTRRGKKSGDRVRRGRRRSLFRGRLDGNEEERRNSFELTPLRFKGGDPLSPRSAVCTRYGSRTCIIGPNCFLASVIAIVPLRPGLLLLLLFSFHRNRCVHLSFFLSFFLSPRFITDRSREFYIADNNRFGSVSLPRS